MYLQYSVLADVLKYISWSVTFMEPYFQIQLFLKVYLYYKTQV